MFPKLRKNAVIGIVAPGSPTKLERIEKGVKKLESLGYKVVLGKSVNQSYNKYLSGTDDLRANDINDFFEDDSIDAIICQNGGYGTPRIVDKIDYDIIKKHPKIFSGFSDITLLLNSIYTETGLVTFHGPMLAVDFSSDTQEIHLKSFFDLVTTSKDVVINEDSEFDIQVINEGIAEGILVGGNLSLIDVLLSTKYLFDSKDKILLIEDVREKNIRLDRMIQKLRLSGVLDDLKGIIIGGITSDKTPQEGSFELFKELLSNYDYPVIFNAPIGHITPRYTVPIGGTVIMNTYKKTIIIKGVK